LLLLWLPALALLPSSAVSSSAEAGVVKSGW
jgi:hypothetical protein